MFGSSTAIMTVLVTGLALRFAAAGGTELSDPFAYTSAAYQLANGHFPASTGNYRLAVYAPVAMLIRLAGASQVTVALYPLSCSLVTIIVAWATARHLLGRSAERLRFGSAGLHLATRKLQGSFCGLVL